MKVNKATAFFTVLVALSFVAFTGLAQGQFVRSGEIPVPETDLNIGGTGNMVSGVDLDGDGQTEIYLVNDNWNDKPDEMIPRIYKLEKQGDEWVVVWKAVAPVEKQNTWPTLNVADLDKDGKHEIIWGIVNNTSGTTSLNPARILVYEVAGDGSDVLGVDDGAGAYLPNAKWTIAGEDNVNIRPIQAIIADPDDDGIDEFIFADRAGNNGGYYCGVVSVSDIPDTGDGSEEWTLEVSGLDFDLQAGTTENKWDVVAIGPNVYSFCEVEVSKYTWTGSMWEYKKLQPMAGGASVQSAQVVDLDKDGVMEIIAPVYDWGVDAHKSIYLLQEEGDSLKHTELINVSAWWPSGTRGPWGGASGDIDGDGLLDFIYGSRASTPNAGIFHLAYKGGDITDPANYAFEVIDSEYAEAGIWSVVNLANIDNDPQLEVLYTSSTDAGAFPNLGTKPIVVLDFIPSTPQIGNMVVASEVLLNGEAPTGLAFKQGRILDNNQTVWFLGTNTTTKETWIFRSVDGGKTFTHNATPIPGRAAQMDAFNADIAIVATAEGQIWKSEDGGATFSEVYSYMINPALGAPGWFDALRVVGDAAVAVGDFEPNGNMHFVRSIDQGSSWTLIEGIDFLSSAYAYYTWGLAGCTVGQNMWVAATNMEYVGSYVFRTGDAGATWESFEISTDIIPSYPRAIAFSDENNGLIADRRGNVVASTDGGATWTVTNKPDTSSSSWCNGVVAIPNSNIIMGLDDLGVYFTSDLGTTWTKVTIPTEVQDNDYMLSGVFGSPDFGYVFTDNGLVLRFENQLTDVAKPNRESLPVDFQLSQNYPNPFNPTTTIAYTLNSTEKVSLKIYNLQGQEIKTLVDGMAAAGSYAVNWDGTDHAGQKVPSGLYIYALQVKTQLIAKRMLLVK